VSGAQVVHLGVRGMSGSDRWFLWCQSSDEPDATDRGWRRRPDAPLTCLKCLTYMVTFRKLLLTRPRVDTCPGSVR